MKILSYRPFSAKSFYLLLASLLITPVIHANDRIQYNPQAKLQLTITEVEYRKTASGRSLMARIYQPAGKGPFPTVIDLHGGAWNNKDRFAEQPMNRAIAESGVLVIAIDLTSAKELPYPANVLDANYGVRWVKHHAKQWRGDTSKIGLYGSSSGGHIAELLGLRPNDPRYNSLVLHEAPQINARVDYIMVRSPISNPYARYQNALKLKRPHMITNNINYFRPMESIHEGNPQEILDRKESVELPPLLIMQGDLDDNVLPITQEQFIKSYKAAGGNGQLIVFKDSEHEWVAQESVQTDKARQTVREFIARQYQ